MKMPIECHRAQRTLAFAFAFCLLVGCSAGIGAPVETFVPLTRSLAERLLTADQVALTKWDNGQPVYAPQREAQVIASAAAKAPSYQLTAAYATDVFTDQIEANKEVQYALLAGWRRQGHAPSTPRQSLSTLRSELDALELSILQNLQTIAPLRGSADCSTQVALAAGEVAREKSLDALHLAALDRATARICTQP
jgi:chorismate mutase